MNNAILSKLTNKQLIDIIDNFVNIYGENASNILNHQLNKCLEDQCWILKFPMYVLSNLYMKWLTIKDFTMLDKAICNKKLRLLYFNHIKENKLILSLPRKTSSELHIKNMFNWLITRHIEMSNIDISYYNHSINIHSIKMLLGKSLNKIDFSHNNQINDDIIINIINLCENLNIILLKENNQITSNTFIGIISTCKQLKVLDIANCHNILDGIIITKEDSIELSRINEETSISLLYQCYQLESFGCFKQSKLTNSLLDLILKSSCNYINISYQYIIILYINT